MHETIYELLVASSHLSSVARQFRQDKELDDVYYELLALRIDDARVLVDLTQVGRFNHLLGGVVPLKTLDPAV